MSNPNPEMLKKLKSSERYKSFTYLEFPTEFAALFAGKDYPVVQVHDATPIDAPDGIVGFAGTFSWIDGIVTPLDGDSYTKRMTVIGYEEFECAGETCLDVISDDW